MGRSKIFLSQHLNLIRNSPSWQRSTCLCSMQLFFAVKMPFSIEHDLIFFLGDLSLMFFQPEQFKTNCFFLCTYKFRIVESILLPSNCSIGLAQLLSARHGHETREKPLRYGSTDLDRRRDEKWWLWSSENKNLVVTDRSLLPTMLKDELSL